MINGLHYFPDFLTTNEHNNLLACVDNETWELDLKRRVQQYGYKYDYKKRGIDASQKIGNLPTWVDFMLEKMKKLTVENTTENNTTETPKIFIDFEPDQLIINEYEAGQGIAPHIDCEPCFEDTIVSISLGSAYVMDFISKHDKNIGYALLLSPCSMLVMQQEARYDWLHGIKPKKTDVYQGNKIQRARRVSLTFRKVKMI